MRRHDVWGGPESRLLVRFTDEEFARVQAAGSDSGTARASRPSVDVRPSRVSLGVAYPS